MQDGGEVVTVAAHESGPVPALEQQFRPFDAADIRREELQRHSFHQYRAVIQNHFSSSAVLKQADPHIPDRKREPLVRSASTELDCSAVVSRGEKGVWQMEVSVSGAVVGWVHHVHLYIDGDKSTFNSRARGGEAKLRLTTPLDCCIQKTLGLLPLRAVVDLEFFTYLRPEPLKLSCPLRIISDSALPEALDGAKHKDILNSAIALAILCDAESKNRVRALRKIEEKLITMTNLLPIEVLFLPLAMGAPLSPLATKLIHETNPTARNITSRIAFEMFLSCVNHVEGGVRERGSKWMQRLSSLANSLSEAWRYALPDSGDDFSEASQGGRNSEAVALPSTAPRKGFYSPVSTVKTSICRLTSVLENRDDEEQCRRESLDVLKTIRDALERLSADHARVGAPDLCGLTFQDVAPNLIQERFGEIQRDLETLNASRSAVGGKGGEEEEPHVRESAQGRIETGIREIEELSQFSLMFFEKEERSGEKEY
uniref:Uncharacterized protein n=1 Tax=Chromera velia CCMP2878 TaxID=1169474 RepID=A0A0G4IBY3_9ALVE|eukprot:Cvel_2231.t1-p1 / transcript=Cvel_2231.t1 / gene=Cvel_2231 / organism=Chromera_velia_CCMP2878 / gene_product=hypothetical protein / transcript_product=hypothetical protein / location=Cvel_scaffold86:29764-31215(+) / protein_length=484 / sequence_SO=supercontig / SO=protein_coding / is_pseudo=false